MSTVQYAPLIRGSCIAKSHRPWIVAAVDKTIGEKADSLEISVSSEKTEQELADLIVQKMNSYKGIPARIVIAAENNTFFYFIAAPDMNGIENIKKGAHTAAWQDNNMGAFTSRSDVVKNRVFVVTGGAQGFGEELVRGLVAADAIVFIADLNFDGAKNLSAKLNQEKGKTSTFAVSVNVGDEESVKAMFNTIAETTGALDACISNAGILRAASILDQDIASFKLVTDINYTAFAIVSKYCALLMKKQQAAAPNWMTDIIQINSKSGLEGSNKNGSYAGGKFGGIGLVQSFALELVTYGIKVNAICPGNFYDGPLWSDPVKGLFIQYLNTGKVPGAKNVEDVRRFYEAKSPIHRGCTGQDVLKAVFYIVEQEYETGQAVPVTGGQVMLH